MLTEEYARNYAFETNYWWFVGRRALVVAALRPPLSARDRRARLLDVGCGTGYTLETLAGRADGFGADIAPEALAFCRQRGLDRLALAAAERLPYSDDSFDVLTALDVLEHLDDDLLALREWQRVLRPGGRAVLFVPAFESLWSGEDFVSQHRRRYRRGALVRKLRAAGFIVLKATYADFLLFPAVAAAIYYNRLFHPRRLYESNLKPLPGWLNRLLGTIFSLETHLLANHDAPYGTSLFCIAEKPTSGGGSLR